MKRLTQAAKDLQAKNSRMGNPPESVDDLEKYDAVWNKNIRKENKDEIVNRYIGEKINPLDISGGGGSGKQFYKCEEC